MGAGGNEIFPGEGGVTRLDFAITCLNFTYSVFICAVLIKILVLDIYNNRIMYNSGLRVIIVYSMLSQFMS